MTHFRHGLLIGKFYPPHRGHHRIIREAAGMCERLTVLVMASMVETIPLRSRVRWIHEEHARDDHDIRVVGARSDIPQDVTDDAVWTAHVALMQAALRREEPPAPDAVFTSEDYGPELARRLGARHIGFHRDGLSATAIRNDLHGRWNDLATATRAGLTARVVAVGGESTGTTTISTALAEHYQKRGGAFHDTRYVSEYGRDFTRFKMSRNPDVPLAEMVWTASDFDEIAVTQTQLENIAAGLGSPVLFCDTDAFATAVWERRYLGERARTRQPWARQLPDRAIYLVTDHRNVEWDDDGLREGDLAVRAAMTEWFTDALTEAGHPWILLTGSPEARLSLAIRTVDQMLDHRRSFGEPLHGPGFEGAPG